MLRRVHTFSFLTNVDRTGDTDAVSRHQVADIIVFIILQPRLNFWAIFATKDNACSGQALTQMGGKPFASRAQRRNHIYLPL